MKQRLGFATIAVTLLIGCGESVTFETSPIYHLVGAGDIARCDGEGDEATAALLDTIPGIVLTAGDHAYPRGSAEEFTECYEPSWGRHKDRTRPAVGNHDTYTEDAGPYYDYFGEAAGPRGKGYYSYDIGEWHAVVLNSMLDLSEGAPQHQWLLADLEASPSACTIAYFHHPRFSSGRHGDQAFMQDAWRALYDGGVDVVVAGHDHIYERFRPLDANGEIDGDRGIRSFVVGTGGASFYDVENPREHSAFHLTQTFGVLHLTLEPDAYAWAFVDTDGAVRDEGDARCH